MNSRERVLAALDHREPDRIPFDLSSTPVTGIHHVAYSGLREALKLPSKEPQIWHVMQQLAWMADDAHDALETDAKGLRPNAQSSWSMETRVDNGYVYYTDEWGIERRRVSPDGFYFDLCRSPLAAATNPTDIKGYPFPNPVDPARLEGVRDVAAKIRAEGRAFVLGGICPGMLEMGQWLRGYEAFFCDLVGNRPLAEVLCDKIIELKMAYWSYALPLVGDMVDVIQEGDDYGAQNALQVSPQTWREIFKPRLKQLIGHIKSLAPQASLFFHCCGSIRDILPELIEVGIDALNPVQVAAAGMDSAELKREFGSDLVFWGGGVDTQQVLPTGTPHEVREEVRRRVDDFAPGGGFVFAAVHNIQADVPAENIVAMREALLECGCYDGVGTV